MCGPRYCALRPVCLAQFSAASLPSRPLLYAQLLLVVVQSLLLFFQRGLGQHRRRWFSSLLRRRPSGLPLQVLSFFLLCREARDSTRWVESPSPLRAFGATMTPRSGLTMVATLFLPTPSSLSLQETNSVGVASAAASVTRLSPPQPFFSLCMYISACFSRRISFFHFYLSSSPPSRCPSSFFFFSFRPPLGRFISSLSVRTFSPRCG